MTGKISKFLAFFIIAVLLVAGCIGPREIEAEKTATPEPAMSKVTEAPTEKMEKAPEASMEQKVSIEQVDAPASVFVGQDIRISWRVAGGDLRAMHTAVHYGFESKPGTFGFDVGPAGAGYQSLTTEFVSGEFALPKDFVTIFRVDKAGVVYFRVHAMVDGKNYWTDEKSIVVKEIPSIEITVIPEKVREGETFQVAWVVKGRGLRATHSALHYEADSKPGEIGLDKGPQDVGYPQLTTGFLSGDYALPMEFKAEVKADIVGVLYIRAHVIVDEKHYWTAEKRVEVIRGPGIVITSLPSKVTVGADLKVTWQVFGDDLRATHTAVHYGYESKPGTFGLDVGPAGAGYPSLTTQFASGDFVLPMEFSASFKPDSSGKIYLRAHAIVEGKNYWTEEQVVTVERIVSGGYSGSGTYSGGTIGGGY